MKTLLLALISMFTILTTATPALGSQSESSNVPSSETHITKDGFLDEGDTQIDCRGFDQAVKQHKDVKPSDSGVSSELKKDKEALRYCKDHGYKSLEEPQLKSTPVKGSLPDTGGISLAVLGAGVLLATGGLLYRKCSL